LVLSCQVIKFKVGLNRPPIWRGCEGSRKRRLTTLASAAISPRCRDSLYSLHCHVITRVTPNFKQGFRVSSSVSRQLRLRPRCRGNATTPLLTPALNHAANIISRHQREFRRRLLAVATSMTLLTDLESLLESFLGKYRWIEPLS
jgi:hypothetical protein